jgi:predicted tellurium resistance membrane protein TerC
MPAGDPSGGLLASIFGTFAHPASWVAVLTLALLEIVLGIDNLVFIAILTSGLPRAKQKAARQWGLVAALGTRLLLLFSLSWIARLTAPIIAIAWLEVGGRPLVVTGQSLVLLVGGVFLMYKSVSEIYHKVELGDEGVRASSATQILGLVIANIAIMDVVFSLDSVITAVGLVNDIPVMVAGIVLAMFVMVSFADPVANFINEHASLKILALAFLLMIGTLLTSQAVGFEVPKGFLYFAMCFALGVQAIQMRYEANLKRRQTATRRVD